MDDGMLARRLLDVHGMNPVHKILVPTDLSPGATRAMHVAVELAATFDAELTLLHVLPVPADIALWYAEGLSWPLDEIYPAARREISAVADALRKRHPKVDSLLGAADPRTQILETAKEIGADLIIMGTHGRTGITHLVLGSVAERVVRASPVPVLTVGDSAARS